MTTLIIGGTGNTGLALAKLLHTKGHPVLLTSRSGKVPEPFNAVAFDWTNSTTFENPFKADNSIDKIYFLLPGVDNSLAVAQPFLDQAISSNVKKFVMLGTNVTRAGGPAFAGDIYQYFIDNGVDYTVLRPTWFMQNYAAHYLKTIKEGNYFFTASTDDAKIAPISTDDIAEAAFEVLTTNKYTRQGPFMFGPEALSNEEIAKVFSTVVGREIHHKQITPEERAGIFITFGMPEPNAKALVDAELANSHGAEEKTFLDPKEVKIVGKTTLKEFIEGKVALWQ